MSDLREELARALAEADGQRNIDSLPETLRIVYALQAKYIEPIITRAVAAEREACAKVAFEKRAPVDFDNGLMRLGYLSAGNDIAAAIRGRP